MFCTYGPPYLAEHKTTHSGEKSYECNVCNKKFSRSGHLVDHKRIHNRENPHECDICNKRFSLLTHLADHKSKHAEDKRHECDVCHQIFTQSGAVARHKRSHTGDKPFECDVCHQTFARSNSLRRHKITHTGDKPHQCDICKERFSRSSHLARHVKRKHSEKNPKKCDDIQSQMESTIQERSTGDHYECDICNQQLPDFKSFVQHKVKDHGISDQNHICTDELQLKTELTDIQCVCSLCGISFDIPQQLEHHMNTHGMG